MVKITRIWQTKNFLRPVAAVMAARAFLFSSREAPFMQKIKLSFCCLLFTASCLLFLSPATASASTYQDVQKVLNDNPAPSGCVNWLEEVTTNAGKGYKVWRRCESNVLAYQNLSLMGGTCVTPPNNSYITLDVFLCNATKIGRQKLTKIGTAVLAH